jgi:hypothetical protein
MVLVSGATGTAGKEIVLQLASLGILTKALVRLCCKTWPEIVTMIDGTRC